MIVRMKISTSCEVVQKTGSLMPIHNELGLTKMAKGCVGVLLVFDTEANALEFDAESDMLEVKLS